jgi:hypothetical protein
MTAVLVALVVFLGLIVLLLWGAYAELGRELPCKRSSRKHGPSVDTGTAAKKTRPDERSHTRHAA